MKKIFSLVSLVCFISSVLAQIPSSMSYKEKGGFGAGLLAFKDEATSPITYKGIALSLASAKVKRDEYKETKFGRRLLFGTAVSNVEEEKDVSQYLGIDIYYTYLRNIPKLSFLDIDVQLGGTLDFTSVIRMNSSFQNNVFGLDFFPTLMGSLKIKKQFFDKPLLGKWLDLPVLKQTLGKLFTRENRASYHQELSFQLDVGIINSTFRNGYAYTSHAPFHNDTNIFSGHQFNWFSGFRIRSSVNYLFFSNKTKNGVKLSYNWEGTRSGQHPDRFAFTNGIFQFSLIHRLY